MASQEVGLQEREIRLYRVLCWITIFAIPLSGFLYLWGDPYAHDPIILRLILGAIMGIILLVSYVSAFAKKNLDMLYYAFLYPTSLWTAYLFYQNHFAPNYLTGIFISLTLSSLLKFRSLTQLLIFLCFNIVLNIVSALFVTVPQISPSVAISMYGLVVTVSGITAWTKTHIQKRLEQSEFSLFTIFNESADAIYLVTPKTFIVEELNSQALKLSDSSEKKEARGSSLLAIFSPLDPFLQETWLPTDLETGAWNGQQFLKTKDGVSHWFDIAMRPIAVFQKQLLAVRFSDVTKIRTAEQELAGKAQQLAWINKELTSANQQMVQREQRMVELMQEIDSLKKQLEEKKESSSTI